MEKTEKSKEKESFLRDHRCENPWCSKTKIEAWNGKMRNLLGLFDFRSFAMRRISPVEVKLSTLLNFL